MTTRPRIATAAALLAALTAASQILGFLRDAVIAAVFGAGAALDAYLVAQGLMNLVLALVAGAMARALVPPVSRASDQGRDDDAHRTVQTLLTTTLLVLVTGSVVMYVAADVVVLVLAPGFDPATRALAVDVARIVLVAAAFIGVTDVLAAAAQSHGRFAASGLQGIPFNLVMIAAAGWWGPAYGVEALAYGFVVGSIARMLLQFLPLPRIGLRLRPRWDWSQPDAQEALRLIPALLVTTAAVNVNTLVDRAVGSAVGEGVVAALSFGWRLVTLVDSLLVVTLVAALYPALGRASDPANRSRLRALVTRSLRACMVLLAPVVGFLTILAEPLVRLLFGRGAFDDAAVALTALAVSGYSVSAAAIALRSIGTRASLALGDRRTPIVVALTVMAVNAVGDLTLGLRFGVSGLAASTSLSLAAGAIAVLWRLGRRHAALTLRPVILTAARTTAATAIAVAGCTALGTVRVASADATASAVVGIVATALTGGALYAGALLLLRGRELHELRDAFGGRRGRSSDSGRDR